MYLHTYPYVLNTYIDSVYLSVFSSSNSARDELTFARHEIIVISDDEDSDAVVEITPPPRRVELPEPVIAVPRPQTPAPAVQVPPPVTDVVADIEPPPHVPAPAPVTEPAQPKRVSYRGSLPARYPSPPPPTDPLGPAAQYPYLYVLEKDGVTPYSCRPHGPKVYDLLSTLPLKPFGIMSWEVVDREEELFELEEVNDEDKSMLAIWNRWIKLNRYATPLLFPIQIIIFSSLLFILEWIL